MIPTLACSSASCSAALYFRKKFISRENCFDSASSLFAKQQWSPLRSGQSSGSCPWHSRSRSTCAHLMLTTVLSVEVICSPIRMQTPQSHPSPQAGPSSPALCQVYSTAASSESFSGGPSGGTCWSTWFPTIWGLCFPCSSS